MTGARLGPVLVLLLVPLLVGFDLLAKTVHHHFDLFSAHHNLSQHLHPSELSVNASRCILR